MPVSVKTNFEQFRRDVERFKGEVSDKAMRMAENAAARVAKYAAAAAAPVSHSDGSTFKKLPGNLKGSIAVFRSKTKDLTISGDQSERTVKVGPSTKGYYGYFLDRGWKATGPHRRKRSATGNTHSQSGTTKYTQISGSNWFSGALERAESAMVEAGRRALEQAIRKFR